MRGSTLPVSDQAVLTRRSLFCNGSKLQLPLQYGQTDKPCIRRADADTPLVVPSIRWYGEKQRCVWVSIVAASAFSESVPK